MLCRWRCLLLFFIPDFSLFMDSLYVCTMGIIIEDLMLIKTVYIGNSCVYSTFSVDHCFGVRHKEMLKS